MIMRKKMVVGFLMPVLALWMALSSYGEAWIRNGTDWKDTDGNRISCHEGGMSRFADTFFWYGTSYADNPKGVCAVRQQTMGLQRGMNCYSSKDLVNWKYEGVCMDYTQPGNALNGSAHRPSVVYNERLNLYVMWFFDIVKYPGKMMRVAVSESPAGPFRIMPDNRPSGQKDGYAQDCAVFKDEDGKAYLAYDYYRNLAVDELTDDCLHTSTNSVIALPKAPSPDRNRGHEGTAFAKYKGKYIVAGSGVRGWHATETHCAVADHPLGPYGEKCLMSEKMTWGCQISNFIYIRETDTLMALCDQWAPIHGPDCKNCKASSFAGKHDMPLDISRYLWLPVELDPKTGQARMVYTEKWNPLISNPAE
jgi:hypothetical protein